MADQQDRSVQQTPLTDFQEVTIGQFADQLNATLQKYPQDALFKLASNNDVLNFQLYFAAPDIRVQADADKLVIVVSSSVITLRSDQVRYVQTLRSVKEGAGEVEDLVVYDAQLREVIRLYGPSSAQENTKAPSDTQGRDDGGRAQAQADEAQVYIEQGNAALLNGAYAPAIKNYTEAIKRRPTDGGLFVLRADIYARQGRYDEAIVDYTAAIDLSPDISDYYLKRGKAYFARGILPAARGDYDKAIELDPSNYIRTITE